MFAIIDAIRHDNSEKVGEIIEQIYRLVPAEKRDVLRTAIETVTEAGGNDRWYLVADLWEQVTA